tara:strand:+ start:291 stop:773 length:483 start_codon:yes stop_codon:yes gene_type:complete
MQVLDNFLEQPYFNKLSELLNSAYFPWYTTKDISNTGQFFDNLYYQTHTFFLNHQIMSDYFSEIKPLIDKLEVKSLIRAKANLYPVNENLSEHGWHTDFDYENKTALLYINDTDGYTKFKDGTKVESVANRMLIFNSQKEHLSTNCTNDWARVNINLNYF